MRRPYSKLPPGIWRLIRFWLRREQRIQERKDRERARAEEIATARERLRREQNERAFEKRWGRMF